VKRTGPLRFTRRHLMATGLTLGASSALGAPPTSSRGAFDCAQLIHGGNWNPRPTALRRLLWELAKRTSVEVAADGVPVAADSRELFFHPLLYWAADGEFPPLDTASRAALARYITFGGFVVCDSVDGQENGGAVASFERELKAIIEDTPLQVIPRGHVIYKSFYLLDRAQGRTLASDDLLGIQRDNRVSVVITRNDLGGAYARDNFGLYLHEVVPGGDTQRESAFRLGVNLIMYALCLDYKEDQVHIPFILKKRRR